MEWLTFTATSLGAASPHEMLFMVAFWLVAAVLCVVASVYVAHHPELQDNAESERPMTPEESKAEQRDYEARAKSWQQLSSGF